MVLSVLIAARTCHFGDFHGSIWYDRIVVERKVGASPGVSYTPGEQGLYGIGVIVYSITGGGEGSVVQGGMATLLVTGFTNTLTNARVRLQEVIDLSSGASGIAYGSYTGFSAKATGKSNRGSLPEINLSRPNLGIAINVSNSRTITTRWFETVELETTSQEPLGYYRKGSKILTLPIIKTKAIAKYQGSSNFWVASSASSHLNVLEIIEN